MTEHIDIENLDNIKLDYDTLFNRIFQRLKYGERTPAVHDMIVLLSEYSREKYGVEKMTLQFTLEYVDIVLNTVLSEYNIRPISHKEVGYAIMQAHTKGLFEFIKKEDLSSFV